jgi:hypothetical protein
VTTEPSLWQTYWRALKQLAPERAMVAALVVSNSVIGIVPLGEAYLWGRVVDALTTGSVVYWMIAAWAGLGLFGILAGVTVAVAADRLAHRRRLIAMSTLSREEGHRDRHPRHSTGHRLPVRALARLHARASGSDRQRDLPDSDGAVNEPVDRRRPGRARHHLSPPTFSHSGARSASRPRSNAITAI